MPASAIAAAMMNHIRLGRTSEESTGGGNPCCCMTGHPCPDRMIDVQTTNRRRSCLHLDGDTWRKHPEAATYVGGGDLEGLRQLRGSLPEVAPAFVVDRDDGSRAQHAAQLDGVRGCH